MNRRLPLRSQKKSRARTLSRAVSIPFLGGGVSGPFLVVVAVILIFVSTVSPQSVSGLRMSATDAVAPLLSSVVQPITKAADVVRNISGLGELQAENIRLQQENLRLKEWYQTALLLESENKSLRDLLNVKIEPHHKTITARVLADPGNAFAKSILVSAGRKDGVEKGQAVMSGEGVIGRIVGVGQNSARILLMTDINSRIPVLVENTRQHAVLAGHNRNTGHLLHLPPDSTIKDGARIITSGHGGMFPQGLAIGRVQKQDGGIVIVQPFADFGRMTHVRILDKAQNPNLRNLIERQGDLN